MSASEAPPLALSPRTRLTPQRRAILDAIAARSGTFTIVELYDRVRRRHTRVGLATVYRTVELLRRSGSVRPFPGEAARDRAVYVRCHPSHHHHLVCLSCGAVEETELCAAPPEAELKRRHGFSARTHDVDFYGTCARCA